jgi:SAM-dependent methyltransferase
VKGLVRPAYIAARYGGQAKWCPCCDHKLRRFVAYNGVPDRACPNCGARSRHRLLTLFLERGGVQPGTSVLHFAAERGLRKKLKGAGLARYITTDLGRGTVDLYSRLEHLPFADGAFDVALCSHVLEHVDDDRECLRELRRVVVDRLLVLVPQDASMDATYEDASITSEAGRLAAFGQKDHLRLYGRDAAARFGAAGFDVETIDYYDVLTDDERTLLSALPGDLIFVCRPR